MGNQPTVRKEARTEKTSLGGTIGGLEYGASEMQGWRLTMEDAHIEAELQPPEGVLDACSIFAVFDGHGGNEVANFCKAHFVEVLLELEEWKKNNVPAALRKTLHTMDKMLRRPKYCKELAGYNKEMNFGSGSIIAGYKEKVEVIRSEIQGLDLTIEKLEEEVKGEAKPIEEMTDDEKAVKVERDAIIKDLLSRSNRTYEGTEGRERAIEILTEINMGKFKQLEAVERELNNRIANAQGENDEDFDVESGCTAIIAVFVGTKLFVANVGDSRAIMSKSGFAKPLSKDHKPLNAEEKQRIETAGGFVTPLGRVNNYLNLSRAVGDLKYKKDFLLPPEQQIITAEPDISITDLSKDVQFVVIACDGIWDVKSNQEVVDFMINNMRYADSLTKAVEDLLDSCIAKVAPGGAGGIGGDNMTCIVVLLQNTDEIYNNVRKGSVVKKAYRRLKTTMSRSKIKFEQ